MKAVGLEGYSKHYQKPITTVFVMFAAMTFAIPLHWLKDKFFRRSFLKRKVKFKSLAKMAWPALFHLLGTGLAQTGLLYTSASLYQLLRCSVIISTAVLKMLVFKVELTSYMWGGINTICLAMLLVSSTTLFDTNDSDNFGTNPKLGFILIMASVTVTGAQFVFEEKVMSHDKVPPLLVVGWEGLWGTLMTVFIAFPLAYLLPGDDMGSLENAQDSWVMWQNSSQIRAVLCLFFCCVTGYNTMSIYLTKYLSSVWHAILDNFRPASVWLVGLLTYYFYTNQSYGESLGPHSYLQLIGIGLLFLGTFIYNGSCPCFPAEYEEFEVTADTPRSEHVFSESRYRSTGDLLISPLMRNAVEDATWLSGLRSYPMMMRPAEDGSKDDKIRGCTF